MGTDQHCKRKGTQERTPPSSPVAAGIDVGKRWLDAHVLDGARERRFDNTKVGRRALRNWLLKHGVERVVFKPTGRFHRNLHQCLGDAGLETVPVNPLSSRRFAEAIGVLAKNDRVDAAMLARYGLLDGLEGTPPPSRNLLLLSGLPALRRKLVEQLAALRKLRDELDPGLRGGIDPAADGMRAAIADCDGRMRQCIAADVALARRAAIVESIPGFGPVNAACLRADMPELGRLDRREAASLFGIAPFDADSGNHRGARHVRGGRAAPRTLLFMAAATAIRCHPACKAHYVRLVARGKSHKVVAVMCRLVTLLTAFLRQDWLWQPEAPAGPVKAAA